MSVRALRVISEIEDRHTRPALRSEIPVDDEKLARLIEVGHVDEVAPGYRLSAEGAGIAYGWPKRRSRNVGRDGYAGAARSRTQSRGVANGHRRSPRGRARRRRDRR